MSGTPVDPDDLIEAPLELQRHPIRAFFWALVLGLGLALVLIVTKVITLAIVSVVLVIAVVVVLGVLWGLFGPAKEPTGPRPVVVTPDTGYASPSTDRSAAPTDGDSPDEPEGGGLPAG